MPPTHTIEIPYVLGLIATRSLDQPVLGINQLVGLAKTKIENGIKAYNALQTLTNQADNLTAQQTLSLYSADLGYGLLLKRYTDNIAEATPEQINSAAWDTVPNVRYYFGVFAIMVACGFFFIFLFLAALIFSAKQIFNRRWFLWMAFLSIPLPWLAAELGWVVAEVGRQPWAIEGICLLFLVHRHIAAQHFTPV